MLTTTKLAALLLVLFLSLQKTALAQIKPRLLVESGNDLYASDDGIIFSKNNRFLALTDGYEIRIYDVKTGFLLKTYKTDDNYSFVIFSNDFKYFRFVRLQKQFEPDDSNAFEAIYETFAGKPVLKKHYDKDSRSRYFLPRSNHILRVERDTIQVLTIPDLKSAFSTLSSTYSTDGTDNETLLSNGWGKYYILNLNTFDTVGKIDLTKNATVPLLDYLMRPSAFFSSDSRYVLFRGDIYPGKYGLQIYDRTRDSVIFSKLFPDIDNDKRIFYRSENFSGKTGVVTLPSYTGLMVYNCHTNDSFSIATTKTNLTADAYLSSDGNHVIIKTKDSVLIYNTATKRKIFAQALTFRDIIVNPQFPFVYITAGAAGNEAMIYSTQEEKVIGTMAGTVRKVSDDGRVLYGQTHFQNFLFNQYLEPVKSLNACTPYTRRIVAGGEPGQFILEKSSDCDFKVKGKSNGFDFSVWDVKNISLLKNDLATNYTFSIRDIRNDYCFFNHNFYFSNGFSLQSFTDTISTQQLNEKYGYLRAMQGRYAVFLSNHFTLENEYDTVTVVKDFSTVIGRFPLRGLFLPGALGIDTLTQQIMVLSGDEKDSKKSMLSLWTYTGMKVKERRFFNKGNEDLLSPDNIAEWLPDLSYVHFTKRMGLFLEPKAKHIVAEIQTGTVVLRIEVTDEDRYGIDLKAGKYLYTDSSEFLRLGSLVTRSNKIHKIYPVAATEKYLLALRPGGVYKDFSPASLLFPQQATNTLFLMDWRTNDTLYKTNLQNEFITRGAVSHDKHWLAFVQNFKDITLVDLLHNKQYTLPGHEQYINHLVFDMPDKMLVSSSMDGTSKFWSLDSLKEIVTVADLTNSDYIFSTPEGYYSCTKGAQSKFAFVFGQNAINPLQLDLVYNRPDIILARLGCADTAKVRAYNNAWKKRIARTGLKPGNVTTDLASPTCDIKNLDSIPINTTEPHLKIAIQSSDAVSPLKIFNVWVNEVPLYGAKGMALGNRKQFDTTITLTLSEGDNKVEAAVMNASGIESFRLPVSIRYTAPTFQERKLHFVGIGIDEFDDKQYNLQWSVKDIRDLAFALKEKYRDSIEIDTLFNANVTKQKVKNLKQTLLNSSVDDKVIVAYSGHGLFNKNYDYFLSTYRVNFLQPEKEGLPYEDLEWLLDSIPARNKLMLIDACHSGEIDKEEMASYKKVQDSLMRSGVKGVIVRVSKDKNLGMKNSFELMQDLFIDIGKSTGATVVSAAGGTQFAQERGDLKNGVFTYAILDYMRNHSSCTVSELKSYVAIKVPALTKGLQVPTSRTENKTADWRIW